MSHIVPLIVTEIVTRLKQVCITDLPADDPTRADVVKVGRFQDDRVLNNIHIAVSGGDAENPDYKDGIVTLGEMDRIAIYAPAREIGGGQLWWRRGVIQVGCYFINEQFDEATAMEYAYTVLGRIENNLESIPVAHLSDAHGEQALKLFAYGNTFFESGGPPSSYIWRGKILWTCLTGRNWL
jgi:hypothetical protein